MKVKTPQIRAEIRHHQQSTDGLPPSEILRMHLLGGLADIEVNLTGHTLPRPGATINAEADTPMPGDTPASVIQSILRECSSVKDRVLFLRSPTPVPIQVAQKLGRVPMLVDAMAATSHRVPLAQNQLWQPKQAIHCWRQEMGIEAASEVPNTPDTEVRESFDLIYFRAPSPGIWDRRAFTYFGGSAPSISALDWGSMDREQFFGKTRELLNRWLLFADRNSTLVFQSGYSRFAENQPKSPLAPLLAEVASTMGYRQVRQHPLEIDSPNCPIDKPALQSQQIQVFEKGGEQ